MEPLRDPNPSDLLEVREPSVPQGLSRLSHTPRAGDISSISSPGCAWGAEVGGFDPGMIH